MINFFGNINNLGYGVFTHNLLRAYDKHVSTDIAFYPNQPVDAATNDRVIQGWLDNAKRFKKNDPSVCITQAELLNQFCGTPMIGFPIFELDTFTETELQVLKGLDFIFQPSSWGKKVVESHGFKHVSIVPGGYDPSLFQRMYSFEQKLKRIQSQGITFIHVGKFEARKSSLEILSSFMEAVKGHPNRVNLIYHVCNPYDPDWLKNLEPLLSSAGFQFDGIHYVHRNAKILIPEHRYRDALTKLYQMADFGLWASKAEGWNLPLLECLASGIPCVTTDNTAQADFIRKGIYPAELVLKSHQKEPIRVGDKWWPIDQEELFGKISDIIQNPERFLKCENACYESVKDFTWENSARAMHEVLKGFTK